MFHYGLQMKPCKLQKTFSFALRVAYFAHEERNYDFLLVSVFTVIKESSFNCKEIKTLYSNGVEEIKNINHTIFPRIVL